MGLFRVSYDKREDSLINAVTVGELVGEASSVLAIRHDEQGRGYVMGTSSAGLRPFMMIWRVIPVSGGEAWRRAVCRRRQRRLRLSHAPRGWSCRGGAGLRK